MLLDPGLDNPSVPKAVVIYTDAVSVDLRVQVVGDESFCHWFGVTAMVAGDALRWSAAPAVACDANDS